MKFDKWIVVMGDMFSGIQMYGPFDSEDQANEFIKACKESIVTTFRAVPLWKAVW